MATTRLRGRDHKLPTIGSSRHFTDAASWLGGWQDNDWINHWKQQKEYRTIEKVYFTKRAVCHVTKQMNDNPGYVQTQCCANMNFEKRLTAVKLFLGVICNMHKQLPVVQLPPASVQRESLPIIILHSRTQFGQVPRQCQVSEDCHNGGRSRIQGT